VVALVKGQKDGGGTIQSGHHVNFHVAHREMDQRPVGERQYGLSGLTLEARQAVKAILVNRVAYPLSEVRLELRRGHRKAVEEQHQVDAVLVVQGIAKLPHHSQAVCSITREDVRVNSERRLELGELERVC